MNLFEQLLRNRSRGGFIHTGFEESVEHPTLKHAQFEDEMRFRLRNLEFKTLVIFYLVSALLGSMIFNALFGR